MQGNFFICMKKSESDPLIERVENLMKMVDREIGDLISLDKSPSYDHRWVPFSYEPDDMQGKFLIYMKKSENGPLRMN
jgi:hypothetical protein